MITGGGTGIGRACALQFAREGARVMVVGRRMPPLEAVVAEIRTEGGEAHALRCDVTRSDDVAKAIQQAVLHFRWLDIVVNNAGAVIPATAEETSDAEWDTLLDVNLKGTFLVSRAVLPAMRKPGGGSIINIGSVLGLVAKKNRAAYCAAKGGVTLLTKAMAVDHAHEGIRVNCICPALVETDLMRSSFSREPDPAEYIRQRTQELPLGRLGTPEDVARLAVFLGSDESSWMTGAALPLNGGLSAY